jgi:hypothetical protein
MALMVARSVLFTSSLSNISSGLTPRGNELARIHTDKNRLIVGEEADDPLVALRQHLHKALNHFGFDILALKQKPDE